MIDRPFYLGYLAAAVRRSPITALFGPRQCGKTTLARAFTNVQYLDQKVKANWFDLESLPDKRRLQNPELVLGTLKGTVVLDEIQEMPELFGVLRVLADRPENQARFLILGSASPAIIRRASESLAGRVELVELSGFDLAEIKSEHWEELWLRGGFPRAYLVESDEESLIWREGFIRTFLERDIPLFGFTIPPAAMRRFWTMLAHYHGQVWNASEIARSMGVSDKTVRSYLDILTGTFMIRQLQPWYENIGKRQVKSPKIYFRDTGLLHSLLGLPDRFSLLGHPKVGASWEGFALEQVLQALRQQSGTAPEAYFWATHNDAELDLFFHYGGRRYGIEAKFSEAPKATPSMRIALDNLQLDHLWIIYPGQHKFPVQEKITVLPLQDIAELIAEIGA
jgi:uncharacterized protein